MLPYVPRTAILSCPFEHGKITMSSSRSHIPLFRYLAVQYRYSCLGLGWLMLAFFLHISSLGELLSHNFILLHLPDLPNTFPAGLDFLFTPLIRLRKRWSSIGNSQWPVDKKNTHRDIIHIAAFYFARRRAIAGDVLLCTKLSKARSLWSNPLAGLRVVLVDVEISIIKAIRLQIILVANAWSLGGRGGWASTELSRCRLRRRRARRGCRPCSGCQGWEVCGRKVNLCYHLARVCTADDDRHPWNNQVCKEAHSRRHGCSGCCEWFKYNACEHNGTVECNAR